MTLRDLGRQGNIPPMAKRELADPIRAPSHRCAAASLVAQRLGLREPWYVVRRTTVPHLCRRRKRDCPRASRQPFSGPRPPTVTLCLAPPALNEFLSADDRPASYYRRRRGGPPGLGRDATNTLVLYLVVDVDMPRRSLRTPTMRPPSTSSLLEPDARLRSPRARPPSTIGCISHFSLSRLRLLTHTLLSHIKKPKTKNHLKTLDGGSLGSSVDEERGQPRELMRIAGLSEHRHLERTLRLRDPLSRGPVRSRGGKLHVLSLNDEKHLTVPARLPYYRAVETGMSKTLVSVSRFVDRGVAPFVTASRAKRRWTLSPWCVRSPAVSRRPPRQSAPARFALWMPSLPERFRPKPGQ